MKLALFWAQLYKYRKVPDPENYHDGDRVTWCHLLYYDKLTKKWHKFEVRGAKYYKSTDNDNFDVITVATVNWTIMAGTCQLTLREDNVSEWLIAEDTPNIELIYETA